MARRRETVIHSCSISERMVKMVFAAGDPVLWGGCWGGDSHRCVISQGLRVQPHHAVYNKEVPRQPQDCSEWVRPVNGETYPVRKANGCIPKKRDCIVLSPWQQPFKKNGTVHICIKKNFPPKIKVQLTLQTRRRWWDCQHLIINLLINRLEETDELFPKLISINYLHNYRSIFCVYVPWQWGWCYHRITVTTEGPSTEEKVMELCKEQSELVAQLHLHSRLG